MSLPKFWELLVYFFCKLQFLEIPLKRLFLVSIPTQNFEELVKMASHWSSEFNMTEHRDLQATTMALDRSGDFLLLAGKRNIAIKNLNDSLDTLKKFPRNNKYDIGTAEWNPTAFNSHLFSLSMNQKLEIFTWREATLHQTQTLKFHTRLVSDLNWHRFDPHLLASTSNDSFTHVWDMRDLRRPAISYSAIASAHHVRWNKLTTYLLATAHDGDIRIWDQRKGSAPIQYISAHLAKIHGLDWSQTHEYQLASCSQDGTVRFFDVTHPKCAESMIQTSSPIWRARYTPFGEGLVTVLISVSHRNDNGLLLWNLSNQSIPVHTFVGHTDVVFEFDWRKNRTELSDYQLITWSKDQSLRIWRIEPFLQKLCGYDFERDSLGLALSSDIISSVDLQSVEVKEAGVESVIPALEATNEISFSNFENLQYSEENTFPFQDPSKSLEMEFYALSTLFHSPYIKFDEMNVSDRICVATATVNSHVVNLKITFPHSYPIKAAPSFQIDDSSTIDDILRTKVLKLLKQKAQQRVKKYRTCLESCLTQLITTLEHSVQNQETENKPSSRLPTIGNGETSLLPVNSYFYESSHDVHIPFPKTCGARFSGVDKLVCFYRASFVRGGIVKSDAPTPRSLSAISGNVSLSAASHPVVYGVPNPPPTVSDGTVSYYLQDRNSARVRSLRNGNLQMSGGRLSGKSLKNVTIYDCSKLFFTKKDLAEQYTFDIFNAAAMCKKNAEVAARAGRMDLMQVWSLSSLIAAALTSRNEAEENFHWTQHPFFKSQIENLIMHYAKMSDIQTAAMLCCAFTAKPEQKGSFFSKNTNSKSVTVTQVGRRKRNLKPGGSPYHTIHPADTSMEGWNFPAPKHNRSNSWSESLDDLKAIANILEHKEVTEIDIEKTKLLDDNNLWIYDEFKRKYADILHRWNLLEARVQVSKFLQPPKDSFRTMEFFIECQQCKKQILKPPYCSYCRKIVLRCAICRISVRGSSNFCFACGHGGHTNHLIAWFKSETVCPTGCGCKCTSEVPNVLES